MLTEQKNFNYEQPKMTYDKETGDVTIHDTIKRNIKDKNIIKSYDEVIQQK